MERLFVSRRAALPIIKIVIPTTKPPIVPIPVGCSLKRWTLPHTTAAAADSVKKQSPVPGLLSEPSSSTAGCFLSRRKEKKDACLKERCSFSIGCGDNGKGSNNKEQWSLT